MVKDNTDGPACFYKRYCRYGTLPGFWSGKTYHWSNDYCGRRVDICQSAAGLTGVTRVLCQKRKPAIKIAGFLWRIPGSNRSPLTCHASALPDELIPPLTTPGGPLEACQTVVTFACRCEAGY